MRTSLNEIRKAESFLNGTLAPDESLLVEARMMIDSQFHLNVKAQQLVMRLLKLMNRDKIRKDIREAHQSVFSDVRHAALREEIHRIFKSS